MRGKFTRVHFANKRARGIGIDRWRRATELFPRNSRNRRGISNAANIIRILAYKQRKLFERRFEYSKAEKGARETRKERERERKSRQRGKGQLLGIERRKCREKEREREREIEAIDEK